MEKRKSKGPSLLAILQIVFLALKITGVVNWSWWIVFSPAIFYVLSLWLVLLLVLILAAIAEQMGDDL